MSDIPDGLRVRAVSPVAAPRRAPANPSDRVPGTGGVAARAGTVDVIAAALQRIAGRKRMWTPIYLGRGKSTVDSRQSTARSRQIRGVDSPEVTSGGLLQPSDFPD